MLAAIVAFTINGAAAAPSKPAVHKGSRERTAGRAALRVLWRAPIALERLRPYLAISGSALFVSGRQGIAAIDPRSGKQRGSFQADAGQILSSPTLSLDGVALAADSRFMYAIDDLGQERWRYPFGDSVLRAELIAAHAPVVGPDGTVYATGPDDKLHAVEGRTGRPLWQTSIGHYSGISPAILLAVADDLLLADTRPGTADPPTFVGLSLFDPQRSPRFVIRLGDDVSSIVAGRSFGIVVTTYVETKSRRGTGLVVALDERGNRRFTIDRGRHEHLLGITPDRQLLIASQDSSGADPGSLIETWSYEGGQVGRAYVRGAVRFAAIANDGSLYAISCENREVIVQRWGPGLQPREVLHLGPGCPAAVSMDKSGRLFVARELSTGRPAPPAASEVIALQTPSRSVASSWAVQRGDPGGSGRFGL